MTTLWTWAAAHYVTAATVLLIVLSTIANRVFPDGKLPNWIAIPIDLLALLAKPGMSGVAGPLSLPLVRSRKVASPGIAAALIVAFAVAHALPACNTLPGKAAVAEGKACESGLKQAEESQGVSAVTAALADPVAWEADLLTLGATYTVEQITCLVRMAVKAAEALLHPQTDGGILTASYRASAPPHIVISNGNAWIAKYGGGK